MLKIIGINLIILVAYGSLIIANTAAVDLGFSIAIGMGVCIFIQVMLNIVAGLVFLIMGRREWGQSLLISAAVLAPVGFVAWLVLLSIYG